MIDSGANNFNPRHQALETGRNERRCWGHGPSRCEHLPVRLGAVALVTPEIRSPDTVHRTATIIWSRKCLATIDAALISTTLASPPMIASPSICRPPIRRFGNRFAVNADACGLNMQPQDGAPHGEKRGLEDIDPVDFGSIGPADGVRQGTLLDQSGRASRAGLPTRLLRIGDTIDGIRRDRE